MRFRYVVLVAMCAVLFAVPAVAVYGQEQGTNRAQSDLSPIQRLDVMRSRLESMRRTLSGAIAGFNASDEGKKKEEKDKKAADSPRARLSGLEKEVGSLLSEVNDVRSKQERAERYDPSILDKLEAGVSDLDERVQAGLRATAGERRTTVADSTASSSKKKEKRGFFGRLLGRGDDKDKYAELTSGTAPGRDRQLFEEATRVARKQNFEQSRYLYNVIITTYPESPFLSIAKLAIADTFYLEGTTSGLIQAASAYQDWLTFFPTHPLADDVMLKIAEVEMRQMGLPDRDISHARKAEQRLKVLLQQFPQTSLRPDVEVRLREVQENLGMHNLLVANLYYDRYSQGKANNPKGAQSRLREIVEKYPNFSRMDEVLFRLGSTYVLEEEPDEAAKYFQQLVRNHPSSEFTEKAAEQLDAIGAAKPTPDPKKMDEPRPERPSTMKVLFREVFGVTPVTVDKNGILIHKDGKGGDLIEEAVKGGGELPVTTPTAPTNRIAPSRPADTNATTPSRTGKSGIAVKPTQPGPPNGSNPTSPSTNTQTTTPANGTPPNGTKP